jgi:hypothetical protein
LDDRPPVDAEGCGQGVGTLPRLVALQDLRDLFWGQSILFLAGRSDSSIGRLIMALTSENTLKTGQDVQVGIAA